MSLDPLAMDYPAFSDYAYVAGNPILLIDPSGRSPENWSESNIDLANRFGTFGGGPGSANISDWIPSIDANNNLVLTAEEGDNYHTLRKFLGGRDNILNLESEDLWNLFQGMKKSGDGSINLGNNNVISKTNELIRTMYDGEVSGALNCFDCAEAISRGQIPQPTPGSSYFMAQDATKLRQDLFGTSGYYSDAENSGNMRFGESLTTFGSTSTIFGYEYSRNVIHSATFLGTSRNGTNYYFSKNGFTNNANYGIFTQQYLEEQYGTPTGFNQGESGFYNAHFD